MIRYLKNFYHLLVAVLANIYYRAPARKLKVIAITGTSGKTTTAHLIYEILKQSQKKVALISSVAAVIDDKTLDTGFHVTTPSPFLLQKLIRKITDCKGEYLILEVTSHALDQYRIFGIPIDIGLITNVAHEHLDYHQTLSAYRKTKAKLLQKTNYSVVNKDDQNFSFLVKKARGKLITYAIDNKADYTLQNTKIPKLFIGKFNQYNALAATTVAMILGINQQVIYQTLLVHKGIPGRMEKIETNKSFSIYIDFAHKPDALEQVLKLGRQLTKGKLIVIFGCAGLRDRLKRPMMGEIAAKYADYIVLTAEDPRTEDVRDIIKEISAGCIRQGIQEKDKKEKDNRWQKQKQKFFWRIPDRQEAINFVLRYLAGEGDLVLICGKGHEQSMCYGRVEYHWTDHEAINKAIYGSIKTTE